MYELEPFLKREIINALFGAGGYRRKRPYLSPEDQPVRSNLPILLASELKVIEMDKKAFSTVVLGVGIVILVASLFADSIGIGGGSGFGLDQIIGSVVGAIVTGVGLFLTAQVK